MDKRFRQEAIRVDAIVGLYSVNICFWVLLGTYLSNCKDPIEKKKYLSELKHQFNTTIDLELKKLNVKEQI
jgi:hypothetical protein